MTPDYNFVKLTMTEVESHLYIDDENYTSTYRAFQSKTFTSTNTQYKPKMVVRNKYVKRQQHRCEHKLCFLCRSPDHQKEHCPKWNTYKNKKIKSK